MPESPVYLDHHATTPCDPRVVDAMLPYFGGVFGNAASRQHGHGRRAAQAVEEARQSIADLIGCRSTEIVFTSGATEADNLALLGVVEAYKTRGRHVITCATEHKAVLDAAAHLERQGYEVTYLGTDADGRVRPEDVALALRDDTVLVSLMLANNEIGTIHPLAEISDLCRQRGALLHTDAAQALAYLDCRVDHLGVDLMSMSAHKAYGPKGVGALYVRRKRPHVRLAAQQHGGGHERGRRSGTLNVPGIVGFGRACELIAEQRTGDVERLRALRQRLLDQLRRDLPDLRVHGSLEHRLAGNLNVSFPGADAERLLIRLDEHLAVSSGAACSSASVDGSYVLRALGDDSDEGSIRIGLGRSTTESEVDFAAAQLIRAVHAQRQDSTIPAMACGATCA